MCDIRSLVVNYLCARVLIIPDISQNEKMEELIPDSARLNMQPKALFKKKDVFKFLSLMEKTYGD